MKIAVIYQTNYGTTKQYAIWIAQSLDAELLERASVKPEKLLDYDLVIYGGGLYASGILGIKLVTKNLCKKLVLFTVGLADPAATDYTSILSKNLPDELRKNTKVFHLRGGVDYKKLGMVHRGMMAMMRQMVLKKNEHELTSDDKAMLETYGKKVDFTDKQTIKPLVDYVTNMADMISLNS